MATNTAISWTDHTFNPWWGCQKISPACDHCYAATFAKRTGNNGLWGGASSQRRFFGDAHWNEPVKWNSNWASFQQINLKDGRVLRGTIKQMEKWGTEFNILTSDITAYCPARQRVFCASMADIFEDREDLTPALTRLINLIYCTPNLDWLLLTKRPENWLKRLAAVCDPDTDRKAAGWVHGMALWLQHWLDGKPPSNVWLGTTIENQAEAGSRIPALLAIPAAVRFLSCEPLLADVDLSYWLDGAGIHWVICGGESGPGARPMARQWAEYLRNQCAAFSVPFHFKQWGAFDEHGQCVGKFKSGNLLDGHLHQAFPK